MAAQSNQQWYLAAHPVGRPKESDFAWRETALPILGEGELRVRTLYLSIDPSVRLRIDGHETYGSAALLGSVVPGRGIGVVEESRSLLFHTGDVVLGPLGWQRYAITNGTSLTLVAKEPALPLTAHLALLGHTGLTAYVGLLDLGQPQPGETLVVSAAAGAVGSIAGQLGRIAGCRVVGIARGAEKCRWLTAELGFDAAIDPTTAPVAEQLRQHCPDGIDIVFENVGGASLDAALAQINLHARIVLCGLIAHYNAVDPLPGPSHFTNILTRRARIEGFFNGDHLDRTAACTADLTRWLAEGRLRYQVEVIAGLEQAPQALDRLFTGSHLGRLVVQVADDVPA